MRKIRPVSKAEKAKRQKLGPHQFEPVPHDEQPEFDPAEVQGATACQVCGYRSPQDTVVCHMCRNCFYCGFYNPGEDLTKCTYCGATLPERKRNDTIEIPTQTMDITRGED